MSDFRSKELISEARETVARSSYSPKKLTLFHTGIVVGASLLVAILSYILDLSISGTGGLDGLSSRAALETAQSVLEVLVSLLSPFWAMGFIAAALNLARRQEASPGVLTKGLRRWGPALRMLILEYLLYFLLVLLAVQIGSLLYSISPAAGQLEALLESISLEGDYSEAVSDAMAQLSSGELLKLVLTILPFMLIPALALVIPVAYRMRLASYVLMDDPRCGALYAITTSFRLTKGHCIKLFKLDLHYWWYYVLEVLVLLLAFGDVLLGMVGLDLNMNALTLSVVFYVLALGGQLALYTWKKPQVFTTYALFYDRVKAQ